MRSARGIQRIGFKDFTTDLGTAGDTATIRPIGEASHGGSHAIQRLFNVGDRLVLV